MREVMLFAVVGATICGLFYQAVTTLLPHEQYPAQVAIIVCGFMSAFTWALSVVGALVLTRHLRVIKHVLWGGWFNFFAAAFAALMVGYSVTIKIF